MEINKIGGVGGTEWENSEKITTWWVISAT